MKCNTRKIFEEEISMPTGFWKKGLTLASTVLVATVLVISLAACGGASSTPAPTATTGPETPAATQTAAATETATAAGSETAAATSTAGAISFQVTKVAQPVQLTGAGATFPYPLYSKWFDVYKTSVDTNVTINYQSIGSGAGKQQITQKTIDFGATDSFMSDQELSKAPGILHIPMVAGAVVVAYNVDGVDKGLKLSSDAITGIFQGKITKWNDPAIATDNPGVKLPGSAIAVVHRSDGSGTTNIFTNYLSAVSAGWKGSVGTGTSVNWPVGIGAKGNEGVAGQIKQLPGSIGYVELAYAVQNKMAYANIKNQAGSFVEPTIDSTKAAVAAAAGNMPADLRATIVNEPGADAYPIAGFTWILVYMDQPDQLKGQALANFLGWALADGDQNASDLLYTPLPNNVKQLALDKVKSLTYKGQPILSK
jgi:phosphate transport system substrate-binding protein